MKPLKAYVVSDDEGTLVQYAKHSVVARRQGACELNADFEGVSCRRAPEFDQYAEQGFVPCDVLVEHGWWFECMQCYQKVCSEPEDDDGEPIELHPIYERNRVYCSQKCKDAFEAEKAAQRQRGEEVAAAALKNWPGISVKHKNGYEHPARVWFSFPGGQGQCNWRLGETTVLVERRDHEAWHRFAEQVRKPQGAFNG
jgi:hypothetical protein